MLFDTNKIGRKDNIELFMANSRWSESCQNSESTFHQLSPYIGKLKSNIARDLINEYSQPGDTVFDPFSGSGTIPLECAINSRHVIAADASIYAKILTLGKLSAPASEVIALNALSKLLKKSSTLPPCDLRSVPKWVRSFFHPKTLSEIINFVEVCKIYNDYFLLSCLLGILHHQRPGFLSYPSSHLVPYLRNNKYSKEQYPHMYKYRDISSRLESKIKRTYKRPGNSSVKYEYHKSKIQNLNLKSSYDCLISSPPYMNTLDYFRDNRLRIWFLDKAERISDEKGLNTTTTFTNSIRCLAKNSNNLLRYGKYAILIVGEKIGSSRKHPSDLVCQLFEKFAPKLQLKGVIIDNIPDIRRSRRDCKKIKAENILIYQRIKK